MEKIDAWAPGPGIRTISVVDCKIDPIFVTSRFNWDEWDNVLLCSLFTLYLRVANTFGGTSYPNPGFTNSISITNPLPSTIALASAPPPAGVVGTNWIIGGPSWYPDAPVPVRPVSFNWAISNLFQFNDVILPSISISTSIAIGVPREYLL